MTRPERREDASRRCEMRVSGALAGREHRGAAANAAGRVGHRPHDRHAGPQDLLELVAGDAGGDRDDQRPRRHRAGRSERARHLEHLQRLEREDQHVGSGGGRGIVDSDRDAELGAQPGRRRPGARRAGQQAFGVMSLDQAGGDRLAHHSQAEDRDLGVLHRSRHRWLSDALRPGGRKRAWRGSKRRRSRRPRTTSGRRGQSPVRE